jgi:septal ring factor EnvC (AmiA/AmiB activator)
MLRRYMGKMKAKQPKPPREMLEIQKEYSDLCAKLGHSSYQLAMRKREVDALTNKINELDGEAAARNALETAKKEAKTEEVKS